MTKFKLFQRDGHWWLTAISGTRRYWLYIVARVGDCMDSTGRRNP